MGQAQAMARLQAAGFRVDSYPVASSRPRGLVITQRPTAGARVPAKSLIRINVSLGPGERPLRVVPDVVGKTEAQAKRVLALVGFTVRTVSQATETSAQPPPARWSSTRSRQPESRKPAGAQVLIYLGSG